MEKKIKRNKLQIQFRESWDVDQTVKVDICWFLLKSLRTQQKISRCKRGGPPGRLVQFRSSRGAMILMQMMGFFLGCSTTESLDVVMCFFCFFL